MHIAKITLTNFRLYHGANVIDLSPAPGKNVAVIVGDNGAGKTTLLTGLVWCLYGKQMQEVDKSYKDGVLGAGGYAKYLSSCMNRLAHSQGERHFAVSVDLEGVPLPGVQTCSMTIERSYDLGNRGDTLDINVDGTGNELVNDFGKQVFVQDFVLPREIAKFFFFDSERIVTIAETQSSQDRILLSRAYAEVLGIKKYEDLRSSLVDLRVRFRRDSASEMERAQFANLKGEIGRLEKAMGQKLARQGKLIREKAELRGKSEELQEKLLREGNVLTLPEFELLQEEKTRLSEQYKELMAELKDLFELVPFAIAGEGLRRVQQQLAAEVDHSASLTNRRLLQSRIGEVMQAFQNDLDTGLQDVTSEVKVYCAVRIRDLLNTHLLGDDPQRPQGDTPTIHDFTDEQRQAFNSLLHTLQTTFRTSLHSAARASKVNKVQAAEISKKLAAAEAVEGDALVRQYRGERDKVELRIGRVDQEILDISQEVGALQNRLSAETRRYEQLANKIEVEDEYRNKDRLAARLIEELDAFINEMKADKKTSLESGILSALTALMHKRDFVSDVAVDINGGLLDIRLLDQRSEIIPKEMLSRGEQQLYATALLKALVKESGIDFPVFVDSPLQKFDDRHSRCVITEFYPHVSRQVVLLALPGKELAEDDYSLLLEHVGSAYVIRNTSADTSEFVRVVPEELLEASTRGRLVAANATVD